MARSDPAFYARAMTRIVRNIAALGVAGALTFGYYKGVRYGLGFLLGDGRLTYRREDIVEAYYNIHFWRGVWGAPDFQYVRNPGYNHDRGPVAVLGLRLHLDF